MHEHRPAVDRRTGLRAGAVVGLTAGLGGRLAPHSRGEVYQPWRVGDRGPAREPLLPHARPHHGPGRALHRQNDVAIGIENEGNYVSIDPPDALYQSLIGPCAFICQQYAIDPTQIFGHQDFQSTQCPGRVEGRLPDLRTQVAARPAHPGRCPDVTRRYPGRGGRVPLRSPEPSGDG